MEVNGKLQQKNSEAKEKMKRAAAAQKKVSFVFTNNSGQVKLSSTST